MSEKKSWRDYAKSNTAEDESQKSNSGKKASSWRDYATSDTKNGKAYGSWRDYGDVDFESIVSSNVVNRVNSWLDSHNSYISDYQKRNSGRKYNYEDAYVSDSSDWLNTATQRKSELDAEADAILSYLEQNKKYLDSSWAEKIKSTLSKARETNSQIVDYSTKDHEWWSGFGAEDLVKQYGSAEDAYKYYQRDDGYRKKYDGLSSDELTGLIDSLDDGEEKDWMKSFAQQKDYEEKKTADIGALQSEIDSLQSVYKEAESIALNSMGLGGDDADYALQEQIRKVLSKAGNGEYSSMADLEKAISQKKAYLTNASRIQKGVELAGVVGNQDFASKSGYVSTESNDWHRGLTSKFGMGYDDLTYEYINGKDNGMRSKIYQKAVAFDAKTDSYDLYDRMTDEQISIYNYHYATGGKDAAEEYLDSIIESLSYQEASDRFSKMKDKTALEMLFAIEAGVDQFQTGVKNLFNGDDYIPTSATQYTSGMVREDFDTGFGRGAYDLVTTTANMLPSIMTSIAVGAINPAAGAWAGNALMGASAAGNAYASAINNGYDKGSARFYAASIGASEVLLGEMIGGISKLGGITPLLEKALAGIENGIARFALQYGGQILSEGIEEGLQEILDPILQNAILNADEKVNWSEVAYSALLGGLSAGFMEGANMTIGAAKYAVDRNQAIQKQYGNQVGELIKEGLGNDAQSTSYKLAQKYQQKTEKGKTMTGQQIRKLLEANQDQITAKDMKLIQQAAEQRLSTLGQTEDVSKIAELATKYATGGKLSKAEKTFLTSSQYGSRVANELMPKNIESGDYSTDWAEGIGTKSVNALHYNIKNIVAEMTKVEDTTSFKPVTERVTDEKLPAVSKTGNTIDTTTGNAVDLSKAKITGIAKDGSVTIETSDGTKIDADSVEFATKDHSYAISAIAAIENMTPESATVLFKGVDFSGDVKAQIAGMDEAFTYGYNKYSVEDMKSGDYASALTDEQMMSAYNMGKMDKDHSIEASETRIMRTKADADAIRAKNENISKMVDGLENDVYYMNGADIKKFDEAGKDLDEVRSGGVVAAKVLKKLGIGRRYFFYESYKRGNKLYYRDQYGVEREGAPNGMYKTETGDIYIDLNAGNALEGLTGYTLGHELGHFIKANSLKQFERLAGIIDKMYSKTGKSLHDRVLAKQGEMRVRNENLKPGEKRVDDSYEAAREEVICDALSTMITDGTFFEKLEEIKSTDKGLWESIKKFFRDLIDKFRKAYERLTPDQQDAKDIQKMKDMFDELQTAFAEALVEANENFQASLTPGVESIVTNESGDPVAYSTDDGSVMLSIRTYEENGRNELRKYLNKCVSSNQLTKAEMQEMIDGIEEIYTICKEFKDKYAPFSAWSDAAVVRDTHGRPVFSVVTPNGDYKMNLDFSLVCKKRRTLDAVFNEMSKRGIIDDFELGQKSVVKINEIIRSYGLETACALCFVDAKRFRQASVADSFTNLYNELVLSLVPEDKRSSISHFNFAGYDTIKAVENGIHTWKASDLDFSHLDYVMKNYASGTVEHKAAKYIKANAAGRKLLLRGDFMSSKGFDAVKTQNPAMMKLYNAKKGTGGPKAAFGDVQYLNEIVKKSKNWTPAKAYEVGGVRIQSFSDYVPRMVFDYVQMIYDLAATKLPAHAYSKEALFVKQFGLTGIKINMSLIPAIKEGGIAPGLDANGNYVWAGESFDYETAKEIQNAEGYTENCGTICVGVSYPHIVKLLGDPNIRMVIPYHKSGLNPIVAHMNKLAEFTDYTSLKTNPGGCQSTMDKNGSKVEKDFNFNDALRKTGDPKATARQYLDWCAANEYKPRFAEFAWHENYYKLLEDFTLYDKDGNYVPQREVRAVFPKDGSAFGSMKELIESGLEEDAIVEGKRDSSLSSIVDEIQRTLPKTEAEISEEQVAQAGHDLEAETKFSLRDVKVPTRTELEKKDPIEVVDISVAQTAGRFADRRKEILKRAKDIISKPYLNKDTKTLIFLTNNSYTHAFNNLGELQLNAAEHLPELIENAILTHAEEPKYGSQYTDGVYTFFAAAKADRIMPVKLKVKEYNYVGQILPKNIQDYFDNNPGDYAMSYDTVVLEVDEIEESPSGSARDNMKHDVNPGPEELLTIKVAELLGLVNGDAEKYVPKFSERDPNYQKAMEKLEEQNQELRADVEHLKEMLKLQGTLTHGTMFTPTSVEAAARLLKKSADANCNTKELATMLNDLYQYIAKGEELTWEGVKEHAQPAVDLLMDSKIERRDPYAEEVLASMKGSKVYLTEEQKQEVRYIYGSINNFRSAISGSVVLVADKSSGISLDSWWHEMAGLHPDKFDGDITSTDQPTALADLVSELTNSQSADDMERAYNIKFVEMDLLRQVYDSYWNVSTLRTVADVKQKQIDKLKTQHAERMRELKESHKDDLQKIRKENREKMRAAAERAADRRDKADMRRKIRNFKKKLEGKLLRPTDRQYVPVDLINAMVEVCSLIDTDTNLYNPDGSINKSQAKRDETKEKLRDLKDAYEKLETHSDPIYAGEFDDMVYKYLKELRDKFSDKTLAEMTLDELSEMYEILRGIDETLMDARKLIGWGDAESVYDAGDSIVAEQDAITSNRKNGKRNAAQKGFDKIDNLGLSPVRNVERMSGYNQDSALLKLFKKFEQGVRKKNKFVMDSYKSFEHLTSGKAYDDAVYKEVGGKKYTDVNGREFGVSKMQMMQAILSFERETANKMSHIAGSGFSFADLDMLKKGNLRDAISEEYSHRVPSAVGMVAEFTEILKDDKWCQDYMAAARTFFNETAKNAINETSIALKHRIIAKDKNYIPFEVDKNFVVREISAENDIQQTINSYGMMKDTVKGASQPLIITGLNNILDRHIDQVGNVYGLAIEVRNFNKVWNVRSKDEAGKNPTVKAAVERNWGKGGVKHIEQAVQDIQGPRVRERNALYDKIKSNYIGATFLLNLSVVTKQIGSLFSATSMLKWRDPGRMIGNLIYTMANHKKIAAEVDQYTATAWMRRQGMSDAELYTLMTQAKKPGLSRLLNKAPAILNPTKWITAMDHAVALSLWRYAKQDTAKRTGLQGEALLKATAEFYDELVENTQSMTDVLHRPEIQKRGDPMSEALAMFKTDLYQMAGQLQATAGRFMADKSKENGKVLARTAYSIAMCALWGQLMTSVFALLRYKVARYWDDEDDELTMESWLKRQGFALVGDLMGYVFPIFGSEVVGAFENIMYGEADDVVDNIGLTAVNELYSAMMTLGASFADGEMPDAATMRRFAAKALQVFGIPANNILRTLDAIKLHAEDIANGEFLSFNAGADSKADKVYKAIIRGDEKKVAELKATYKTDASYHEAVRKGLRENDPRIHEAAQARYDGNTEEYKRIFREMRDEGIFTWEDIMGAVNAEENAIKNKLEPEKATSTYSASDFVQAVGMDDTKTASAAKDEIISTYVANGKSLEDAEKEFVSSVKSSSHDAYSVDLLDDATAEKLLVEYADMDEDEAATRVSYWAFCKDNPKYAKEINESQYVKYTEFVEPAGIPVDVFVQYINGTKGIKVIRDKWGDIVKNERDQVLPVIDSLPLTKKQKDALYLAHGLPESKIWDVPW